MVSNFGVGSGSGCIFLKKKNIFVHVSLFFGSIVFIYFPIFTTLRQQKYFFETIV